jgi:hypothetical protein
VKAALVAESAAHACRSVRGWWLESPPGARRHDPGFAATNDRRCDCRSAPEDGSGVVVDLVKELVDGAGVEIVVAVPAAVAVGPEERPELGVGVVAKLGDREAEPLGDVGPGRPTVIDGDGLAPDADLEAQFVAKVGGGAVVAELADAVQVRVGDNDTCPGAIAPSREIERPPADAAGDGRCPCGYRRARSAV